MLADATSTRQRRKLILTALARDRQADPALKPTVAELAAEISILVGSRTARVLYPKWRSTERAAAPTGLAVWEALKVKLPPSRGSADARDGWRKALSLRSRAPIIDPDLIDAACLVKPPVLVTTPLPATASMAERAAAVWKHRRADIDATLSTLRATREAQSVTGDHGFGALLAIVGLTPALLAELRDAASSGRAISKRLAQFSLEPEAFEALDRVARLVAVSQPVEAPEWDTAYAIVTQIWKRRQSQRWRDQEQAAKIALDPGAFRVSTPPAGVAGLASSWNLPPWRARVGDRIDWETRLQGRIDQLATVATSYATLLGATEEVSLPQLRDSLIQATPVPPAATTLTERAKLLADRLLIDLQTSGCATTSRIAQAIETIQNLVSSLRTGQLRGVYPDWKIRDEAIADFDAIWEWLGSYATWRAAIFVQLYPENLAVPSLRRTGSPAFWELIRALRNQGTLSPQQALALHADYRRYFLDLSQIDDSSLRASTVTNSNFLDESIPYAHGGTGATTFMFALTPIERGRRVYWSTNYHDASGRAQQSYWRRLAQFPEDIEEVLGASAYTTPSKRTYLYLVVKTSKDQVDHLWFLRFDLQINGTWDQTATQINFTLEKMPDRFIAKLQQTRLDEPPRIRIEDPTNATNVATLDLDRLGASGDAAVQTLGVPIRWGAFNPLPNVPGGSQSMHSVDTVGRPITDVGVHVGGMVAVSLRNPAQTDVIVGHVVNWSNTPSGHLAGYGVIGYYQILWNVDAAGKPAATSGWFAGPEYGLSRAGSVRACSLAWVPGGAAPTSGKLLFCIADFDGTYGLRSWIGTGLNATTGAVTSWSTALDTKFPFQVLSTGFGVAVVPTTGGAHEIDVFTSTNGESATSAAAAKPAMGQIYATSSLESQTPTWRKVTEFELAGTMDQTAGLGLAAAPLKGTEAQCLVAAWLTRMEFVDDVGHLQVWDGKGWTPAQTILAPTGPAAGWFGTNSSGLGIAVADLDKDGRPDLLIYHGDITSPDRATANGYLRMASGVGLAPREAQGESLPNPYKPNYPADYPREFGVVGLPADKLANLAKLNATNTRSNRSCLEEMFYFVPMALALALAKSGQYVSALDWFRTVYDYAKPEAQRALYAGLEQNPRLQIERSTDWSWVQDPLNPHAIASSRAGVYKRYTQLALIRCMLDYADAEFTRDTPESLPLARTLYLTALKLMDGSTLAQSFNGCDQVIDQLFIKYGDVPWFPSLVADVRGQVPLETMGDAHQLAHRLDATMAGAADDGTKARGLMAIMDDFRMNTPPTPTLSATLSGALDVYASAALAVAAQPEFRDDLAEVGFAVDRALTSGLSERLGVPGPALEDNTRSTARGLESLGGELMLPWLTGDPPIGDLGGFGQISIQDVIETANKHFSSIPFSWLATTVPIG